MYMYMCNYVYIIKSGGPEQARQTMDSCFELVGSHQCVYAQAALVTLVLKYPKVSPVIVVSGIHPPQNNRTTP